MTEKNVKDYIKGNLEDAAQKNALDFVNFLFLNELMVHQTNTTWGFDYLGENLSVIDVSGHMGPGGWVIYWGANEPSEPENFQMDEHLKEFAWANVGTCVNFTPSGEPSGKYCNPISCSERRTIFGKEFDHICHAPLRFCNPDVDKLVKIKQLIKIRKHVIDDMKKA